MFSGTKMEMKNFEEMNKKSDMLLVQRLSKIQCKCLYVNVFINLLFKYKNFHFMPSLTSAFCIQTSPGTTSATGLLLVESPNTQIFSTAG